MTSRNMTEVFILMRNNAIQNRNMYDERVSTPTARHQIGWCGPLCE